MLVNHAKFFALGMSVLAAELMLTASPVAAISGKVNSPKDLERCSEEGGTFYLWEGSVEEYEKEDGVLSGICMSEPTPKDLCRHELKTMDADVDETGACKKTSSDDDDDEDYSGKSGHNGGCFLTTACVEMAGLDDDCYELRVLRRFRDLSLIEMPGGKSDIARYYAYAPVILEQINSLKRPEIELSRIYVRYILPSVLFAKAGFPGAARRTYTAMMDDLVRRHSVTPDGSEPASFSA